MTGLYDESSPYSPTHSFIWRGGVFTNLPNVPFLDAVLTSANGLNERGDFSGWWMDSSGLEHAFMAYRKRLAKGHVALSTRDHK